jgi:uncharacterized protein (TIGR03437 family)
VDTAVGPGEPAPDPPAQVTTAVTVTIGGVNAEVRSAVLSPGFAGRYQVEVVAPPDAPAGDEVPVTIAAAGQTSRTVTMAVR